MPMPPKTSPSALPQTPLLQIEAVGKTFGSVAAVDGVSLDIAAGEFFALLGPSGCGKTTLLRMLAGFETPTSGRILLDGVDIAATPPHRRPVNMMFQNYALFPHLTVRQNVAFGLKRVNLPRAEIDAQVDAMLALVALTGLDARKPDQLSGGQQQRVALARALARKPRLLLLDEPLAALDKKLRETTQRELIELQRRLGTTFVIVTHDQDEAMTLADRIGVMDRGRLEQVGTPRRLYEAPASRWVAEFVGDANILDGRVAGRDGGRALIETREAGTLSAAAGVSGGADGQAVCVAVRPEKIRLSRRAPVSDTAAASAMNRLDGTIAGTAYRGGQTIYQVRLDTGGMLRAALTNTARLDADIYLVGQRVLAWFAADDCVVLET